MLSLWLRLRASLAAAWLAFRLEWQRTDWAEPFSPVPRLGPRWKLYADREGTMLVCSLGGLDRPLTEMEKLRLARHPGPKLDMLTGNWR